MSDGPQEAPHKDGMPGAGSAQIQQLLTRWAAGKITLKELKGYTDEELFAIAHTGYFFLMQGNVSTALNSRFRSAVSLTYVSINTLYTSL